jgi:uncharacterized protein YprB with RNaseH-like and TPR domain
MLQHSFSHIPFVGLTTERRIWDSGICSGDEFILNPPTFLSKHKSAKIIEHLQLSTRNIESQDVSYLIQNLSAKDQWRIFQEFQSTTAYLDIETTGLGGPGDVITTIALYDGKTIKHYVNGQNLSDFTQDIQDYKVIVTYNGKTFDIPFIESYFNIRLSHAHLDLRYILASLGYSGGLKSCELQLGIGRTGSLAEVDGFFAVLLWQDYKKKRKIKSLETLLAYNIEDVVNLEYLMITAYNKKLDSIPLPINKLSYPTTPENPFTIDSDTVNRLKSQLYVY